MNWILKDVIMDIKFAQMQISALREHFDNGFIYALYMSTPQPTVYRQLLYVAEDLQHAMRKNDACIGHEHDIVLIEERIEELEMFIDDKYDYLRHLLERIEIETECVEHAR